MTAYLMDDEILRGTILPTDLIPLTDAQVDAAIALSQQITGEANQWQTYLNALALFGIQQWFRERSPELTLESQWLSQMIPSEISQPEQVALLQVQQFQMALVAAESLEDDVIAVPRSMVDSGQPHFYLLVEVLEELGQVRVDRCLRQDQLVRHQSVHSLETEDDLYLLPIEWFSTSPGELLLYLQHLEPAAFSVPAIVNIPSPTLGDRLQPAIQSAINTGVWITNHLDQVAQELSWILLPPSASPAMRSNRTPADQFDLVMSELIARDSIQPPPQIGNAYQDIPLAGVMLRLYAVSWEIAGTANEWMLLLILGTPTGEQLPAGLRFQTRDETQLLAEQTATGQSQNNFLYAQVRGEVGENFYVTLTLNQQVVELPPLTFHPPSSL